MKTYTAVCVRSGKWWAISIPEIKGAYSQARRLDQCADVARSLVVDVLEVPADSFEIDLRPVAPSELVQLIEGAEASKRLAAEAATNAHEAVSDVVHKALESGLSMRDVGVLLGVSHQRVHQLASH